MPGDRPDRVSDVYHAVVQRPPAERAAYLNEACAGDAALRQEVESLLRFEAASAAFSSNPPPPS